jgi:pimeloyl-ACP methyl ester carboxylesterase
VANDAARWWIDDGRKAWCCWLRRSIRRVHIAARAHSIVFQDQRHAVEYLLRPAGRPEVDNFNFLPRLRVPVLMLNGRYDYTFPVDGSQKPYFRWLGTPEEDKRHVLYDAAHDVMVNRTEVVKEVLSWLDQYLDPVAR